MSAEGRHARRLTGRGTDSNPDGNESRPTDGRDDAENERFLRPYAVDVGSAEAVPPTTASTTKPTDLDLLTLVMAARTPGRQEWLRPERETILNHALRARTVAELSAEVGLPVGQVRAMVAEMVSDGSLQRCGPSRPLGRQDILHAVLVGLRSL